MKNVILTICVLSTLSFTAQARLRVSEGLYKLDCYANPNVSQEDQVLMILQDVSPAQSEQLLSEVLSNDILRVESKTELSALGMTMISLSVGKDFSFADTRDVNPLLEKIFSDAVTNTGLTTEQVMVGCNWISEPLPRAGGTTGN